MDYLLKHRITFNPKAPAPFTEAKGEMGERARSDVESDLQMLFNERREPFAHPLVRFSCVVGAIKERRPYERHMHAVALKFLDHIGAEKLRRYKKGAGSLPAFQLYTIRDQAKRTAMEPVNVIRHYVAQGSGRRRRLRLRASLPAIRCLKAGRPPNDNDNGRQQRDDGDGQCAVVDIEHRH